MKKILAALVATITMAFSGGNIAPVTQVTPDTTDFYAGIGFGAGWTYRTGDWDFSSDTDGSVVDPMIGARLGYTFYRYDAFEAAIEGRIMSTFNADDVDTTVYNVFVKPEYWFTPEIGVYGLLGYGYTRWNAGEDAAHKSGFAGGLGAEYQFTKNVSVSADWVTNVWDRDVAEFDEKVNQDVVTLWVNYNF